MKTAFAGISLLVLVGVSSILISGCTESDDNAELPTVGTNEVGFINNTSVALICAVRYEGVSVRASPGGSGVLPYSTNGYIIAGGMDTFGAITISAEPGDTIEAYEADGEIKARIR